MAGRISGLRKKERQLRAGMQMLPGFPGSKGGKDEVFKVSLG
ncbi:hypothetical protein HMPREF9413_3025 [Paenibacillus sp. HGF7]|nr:hypothetical protein HMPREF9413_3025 [Paenibacillus sp. HGF7]EPD92617.1 hypothetical protein HMPREF1207_00388 [Paenibacillus sp. HGH0039]